MVDDVDPISTFGIMQEVDVLLEQAKKKIDANASSTGLVLIVDSSGSMQPTELATIDGINDLFDEQRKTPGDTWVTMTFFDSSVPEPLWVGEPLATLPYISRNEYRPFGGTALLDAIGISIDRYEKWLADQLHRPENTFVQIITDGGENSSVDYTNDDIKKLIDKKTEEGWIFGYLGANQDAFIVAAQYGIANTMTASYAGTEVGTTQAFQSVSRVTSDIRGRTQTENLRWSANTVAEGEGYGTKDIGEGDEKPEKKKRTKRIS